MIATLPENKQNATSQDRFKRLFPTKEELNTRLARAMRTPKRECLSKAEVLKRLSENK